MAGALPGAPTALLTGFGWNVPSRVLTNADLEKILDTTDEWIVSRTGMKERRIVEPGTGASDLAVVAARKALAHAGLVPEDLDLIVVGTVTPDTSLPSAACRIQEKLGATRAAAFDVSAACAGYLFVLTVGRTFIQTGQAKHVLVVGVEIMSAITDFHDRGTAILFGDGAGATVLSAGAPDSGKGLLATDIRSDGTMWEAIHMEAGGSARPPSHETVENRMHFVRMNGKEVFKVAVRNMGESCRTVLEQAGLTTSDVDLVVPHQANMRIIEAMRERLGLPPEKVYVNIERYGNTSSASVPMALAEAVERGVVGPGSVVLFCALGGGLAWGAAVARL